MFRPFRIVPPTRLKIYEWPGHPYDLMTFIVVEVCYVKRLLGLQPSQEMAFVYYQLAAGRGSMRAQQQVTPATVALLGGDKSKAENIVVLSDS